VPENSIKFPIFVVVSEKYFKVKKFTSQSLTFTFMPVPRNHLNCFTAAIHSFHSRESSTRVLARSIDAAAIPTITCSTISGAL
jgi:hypothetical protein